MLRKSLLFAPRRYGDIQHTSVSHDMPEWASGPRTVPGPYGTQGLKGDRVGRSASLAVALL